MRKLIDFSPLTGLVTTTAFQDGKNYVGYEQDVQAHLDLAARCRNERDKGFDRRDEIRHYAFVPDLVILKMRFEDGVNFYDKNDQKKVVQLLETKYKNCKTTEMKAA